jgi:hypothetical protein
MSPWETGTPSWCVAGGAPATGGVHAAAGDRRDRT